jgi:hypothetical protein
MTKVESMIKLLSDESIWHDYAVGDENDLLRNFLVTDEPVVTPLIEILRDENQSIFYRDRAAMILGLIGDQRAIEPLIATLSDDGFRDPNPIPPQPNRLGCDGLERSEALVKFGEIVVEPLILALKDKSVSRVNAIYALAATRDERGVEPIIDLLDDQDDDLVRNTAVMCLGGELSLGLGYCDERAINPLRKTVFDKHPQIALNSIHALASIYEIMLRIYVDEVLGLGKEAHSKNMDYAISVLKENDCYPKVFPSGSTPFPLQPHREPVGP